MQWLVDFLSQYLIPILFNVASWLAQAVGLIIVLSVSFILVGFLTVVYGIVSVLDVGSLMVNMSVGWGLLDPKIGYMINLTGFPTGLSMLGAAYVIRFTLNLIPAEFTRV